MTPRPTLAGVPTWECGWTAALAPAELGGSHQAGGLKEVGEGKTGWGVGVLAGLLAWGQGRVWDVAVRPHPRPRPWAMQPPFRPRGYLGAVLI